MKYFLVDRSETYLRTEISHNISGLLEWVLFCQQNIFCIHICWEAQILVSINFHYKISRYNHHLYTIFLIASFIICLAVVNA